MPEFIRLPLLHDKNSAKEIWLHQHLISGLVPIPTVYKGGCLVLTFTGQQWHSTLTAEEILDIINPYREQRYDE